MKLRFLEVLASGGGGLSNKRSFLTMKSIRAFQSTHNRPEGRKTTPVALTADPAIKGAVQPPGSHREVATM
jgi:hypothetical protein